VVELPGLSSECLEYLDSQGLIGGFDLTQWYSNRKNWILVSFSDQTQAAEIELLAAHLAVWSSSKIQAVEA
jgi:hypothetical protein